MFNTLAVLKAGQIHPYDSRRRTRIQALGIGLRGQFWSLLKHSAIPGRAVQTMGIILDELGLKGQSLIALTNGSQWCFGS